MHDIQKHASLKSAASTPTSEFHPAFLVAWVFCLIFYFGQYALRSAPGVMIPTFSTPAWCP